MLATALSASRRRSLLLMTSTCDLNPAWAALSWSMRSCRRRSSLSCPSNQSAVSVPMSPMTSVSARASAVSRAPGGA